VFLSFIFFISSLLLVLSFLLRIVITFPFRICLTLLLLLLLLLPPVTVVVATVEAVMVVATVEAVMVEFTVEATVEVTVEAMVEVMVEAMVEVMVEAMEEAMEDTVDMAVTVDMEFTMVDTGAVITFTTPAGIFTPSVSTGDLGSTGVTQLGMSALEV